MNSEILSNCEAGDSFKTVAKILQGDYHPQGKSFLTQLMEVMESQRRANDSRVSEIQSGE